MIPISILPDITSKPILCGALQQILLVLFEMIDHLALSAPIEGMLQHAHDALKQQGIAGMQGA